MADMTYYVALAFTRSEDGEIVACEPKEARSSDQAIRMASTRRRWMDIAEPSRSRGLVIRR